MAKTDPTELMRAQMKIHTRYLQVCLGWTGDECRKLVADYLEAMQTPASFKIIEAHLASVVPGEEVALANNLRRAA